MNIDDYVFDENELTMKNTRKNQELRTFKPVFFFVFENRMDIGESFDLCEGEGKL